MFNEQEIDEYENKLEWGITGVRAAIVDSVDAVGFDSWVDACRMAGVVPDDYPGDESAVPVARSDSRAPLTACVAANRRYLKPSLVITRKT
jgi:hypothetical protein